MGHNYCIVPMCLNTSAKTPNKLFFQLPRDPIIRKVWCDAMKRDVKKQPLSSISNRVVCEDHFDIEKDMENYMRWKLQGGYKYLKKGVVPHVFDCQKKATPIKRKELIEKLWNTTTVNSLSEWPTLGKVHMNKRKRFRRIPEEESSIETFSDSQRGRVTSTTQVEGTKVKKDPEKELIVMEVVPIMEFEYAKIQTESLDDSDWDSVGSSIVQICPNSSDAILGVPQKPVCDIVQKSTDSSDDAILGVPVEYLPIPCCGISEKLEHNPFSASDSATSVDIPFAHHNDVATTSQNAPTLIPMKLVPSATAIPTLENLSDENLISENCKDEFDLFGEFVARKLRSMDPNDAHQVQTEFGNLLFKFRTSELNMDSSKQMAK